MAAVSKYFYIKIVLIQEEYLKYNKRGVQQLFIFKNYIQPRFFISLSTFKRYLDIPARRILRDKYGVDYKEEIKKYK